MKLKTRTNQPVYYKLPVSSNIQALSDDLLNSLRVGDVVQKKTGNQKHCYIVTYKEEKHGICLSYFDGSGYLETISYDYTAGHWVYNSKDVFEGVNKNAPDGTLAKVFGLNEDGDVIKGVVSGGATIYEVSNVEQLSNDLCIQLKSGDIVQTSTKRIQFPLATFDILSLLTGDNKVIFPKNIFPIRFNDDGSNRYPSTITRSGDYLKVFNTSGADDGYYYFKLNQSTKCFELSSEGYVSVSDIKSVDCIIMNGDIPNNFCGAILYGITHQ